MTTTLSFVLLLVLSISVCNISVYAQYCQNIPPAQSCNNPLLYCVDSLPADVPNMGTSVNFSVLAGSAITNTGASWLATNIAISPGTSITGFPPGDYMDSAYAGTDAVAVEAQEDLTTVYNNVHGRACTHDMSGTDLGASVLSPGVYCFSASAQLTGTLILDGIGSASSLFVFQIGTTLTTASSAKVNLINSANECNVFWQVGSSATIGTNTQFVGHILALTSITVDTGAIINGSVLASSGAVTIDDATIYSNPYCQRGKCHTVPISSSSSSVATPHGSTSSSNISVTLSSSLASSSVLSSSSSSSSSPSPPDFSSIRGDPQLEGFLGQSYQVHGIDGSFYSLISHPTHQLNAQFTFLNEGNCPTTHVTMACWSHPGSFVSQVGIDQIIDDADSNEQQQQQTRARVTIIAGEADVGFESLVVNDIEMHVSDRVDIANDTMVVTFVDSYTINITTPLFTYVFENSDLFMNQQIAPNVPLKSLRESNTHGLIGQTVFPQVYKGNHIIYVEGIVDDYTLNCLHCNEFLFTRFIGTTTAAVL